jgi:sugar lactone lactonase YvrE
MACAERDRSTKFDPSVTVMTDGQPLRRPDGRQPLFNADSLALSKDGRTLFWQALTGKTLYRIPTSSIQSAAAAGQARPEKVATTEPVDGLWTGENDEIYLSSIANNAVKVFNPADGSVRQLLRDSRLRWPDTFSQGPDGAIYVTASHIAGFALVPHGVDGQELHVVQVHAGREQHHRVTSRAKPTVKLRLQTGP